MTVPCAISASNRRPTIMASAMSVICISSRHKRWISAARSLAISAITSPVLQSLPAAVNVLHEGVEVNALLGVNIEIFEKQVHQQVLPRPTSP